MNEHIVIIKPLAGGQAVRLRSKAASPAAAARRSRHSRFVPSSLADALANAYSAASASAAHTLARLSLTLASLASLQAQSQTTPVLPQGGVAVHGTASSAYNGKNLTVTTTNGVVNGVNTGRSITNWQSFNIGAGHTTQINQPNAQSSSLNRVVTNVPSQIHGTLRSNGQVILVNQNGIAVGAGGVVDTAGFTASTLSITDADYKAKKLRFEGNALAGGVLIEGEDRSDPSNIRPGAYLRSSNGDVMLFAPQVSIGKDAKVKADNGNVIVGAGQSVEVTGRGLEGVKFLIQGADNKAINLGTLQGNAVGVFAGTLRHSGVISAQTATLEGGRVVLKAVRDVEIVKDASLAKAPVIEANGGVNAAGVAQKGGSIQIESAQGNVLVGAGSVISANAGQAPIYMPNQVLAGMNAAGGAIEIIASQGRVITEAGSTISATGSPGGVIRIFGAQSASVASVVNASSPSLGAADAAGTLVLIGSSNVGGTIQILSPQTVSLEPGAQLLASGDAGGGTILVGGDYQGANAEIANAQSTNVSQAVLLEANARVSGDGGKVIVWANNDTYYGGSIKATGGEQGGNGGFGETSGKKNLYFRGRADLSARRGRSGTLLLDPQTILITGGTGASDGPAFGANTSADEGGNISTIYTIFEDDIEALGATTNVILEASSGITFAGTFDDSKLHVAKSLTLRTRNDTSLGDPGGGSINVSGWLNSGSFTLSAAEGLTLQAGTGYSGLAAAAPSITSSAGVSTLSLVSSAGNVSLESKGSVNLGNGTIINAAMGTVSVVSYQGDIALGATLGSGATINARTISLESQVFDGLIGFNGSSSLNATDSGTAITLRGDRLSMDSTATVVATNGAIEVRPWTGSRTIIIGGTTDSSGNGALQISQDEFSNFSAPLGAVRIGDTTAMSAAFTGDILIGGTASFAFGNNPVALLTTGGIISQSQAFSADKLRLRGGTITLNTSGNLVNQLTAQSTNSANLFELNLGSTISFVTTVDGQSGIHSAAAVNLINTNVAASNLYLDAGNITAEGIINITGYENFSIYGSNFIIDSNNDNVGSAGNIVLGSTVINGNSTGSLTLNSSAPAGVAGAINFGNVLQDTLSNALGGLTIDSSGTTVGQITLPSSITVGNGGANITGRVTQNNAASVNVTGTGAITFNGEIQGNGTANFILNLTSDAGNITLNAIAGNGTNVGTVDIFSTSGTVNLNNNITTAAGMNVNVIGGSVNVGNNAEVRAGNLIYIGTNSTAGSNTINIAAGSQLFAGDGNLTLTAEENISINGHVGGYGDININSSAGAVSMNNLINVTGYQTAGTVGSRSASIHGETGVTLAHVNASNIYNATVTTGAGQTIASSGSVTNMAGFNDILLGSSTTVRSNIGFSGAPIRFGTVNGITAYGDLNLYLLAQTGGANLNITNASVDTGTLSTANAEIVSNGNLSINTFSVLGTGTAHLDFLASQNTHITGTVTGNANSDMVLAADEFLILGALPSSITNFNHVGLQGRSNNQNIRFIDTVGGAIAGTTQITYAQDQYLANSVGHVIVGKTALDSGNIEFTGTGNLAPSTLTSARNYSFFSGGSITSSVNRMFDLNSVGFSATGKVDLANVSLANSVAATGISVAAKSAAAINLLSTDAQGVTVNTVGAGAYVINAIESTGGANITLTNTGGAINSGTNTFDFYTGSGAVVAKAYGNLGSVANPLAMHATTFSLGNTNTEGAQTLIAAELTKNGVSTLTASGITLDTTALGLADIYIAAGSSNTVFQINEDVGLANPHQLTLANAAGSIRVTQPNATFSGTGSITFATPSTHFDTITTLTAGHTVTLTGAGTVTASTGVLRGEGLINNTGNLVVDGTISPGSSGLGTIGTLGISGNLQMGSGDTMEMDLGNTSHDRLVIGGQLFADGSLRINETSLGATTAATAYTLATYSTHSGFFSAVSATNNSAVFTSALGASALTVSASSLTNSWVNNSATTLWSGAGNWSRNVVPTASHDVVINPTGASDTNKLVHLNTGTTSSINSLSISGDDRLEITGASTTLGIANSSTIGSSATLRHLSGMINGAGDLNVSGNLIWAAGDFAGTGTLNTLSGSQVTINGNAALERNWHNYGTVTQTSRLSLSSASGQYVNESGGTHHVNVGTAGAAIALGTLSSATNRGTMNWNSAGVVTYIGETVNAGTFNNEGAVNVSNTSTMRVNASGTDTGSGSAYNVASGGTLDFNLGTRSVASDSGIYGTGTFKMGGGVVTLGGSLGLANEGIFTMAGGALTANSAINSGTVNTTGVMNLTGGTLDGSGILTVARNMNWTGGTLGGTGGLTVAAANGHVTIATGAAQTLSRAALNLGTITVNDTLTLNNTLDNAGQINLKPMNALATVTGTGTINNTNAASATISTTAGSVATDYVEFDVTLNNLGIAQLKLNGSHLYLLENLTNTGTITIDSGKELKFAGIAKTYSSAGSIANNGGMLNMADGSGVGTISGGYSGASSTVSVTSGPLTFDQDISIGHLILSGGILGGAGDITTNTMLRTNGIVTGVSGATLTTSGLVTHTGGATSNFTRDWYINGGMNYSGGPINIGTGFTLTNGVSSLMDFNSSYLAGGDGSVGGAGVFVNNGHVRNNFMSANTAHTLTFDIATLNNNGTLSFSNAANNRDWVINSPGTHASGSSLTIPAGLMMQFSTAGNFNFNAGSNVAIDGTLAALYTSALNLNFNQAPVMSSTGTLAVSELATVNFNSGSAVVLTNVKGAATSSANLSGSDAVSITNSLEGRINILAGSGAYTIGSGVNSHQAQAGLLNLNGRALINNGILNISSGDMSFSNAASLTNNGVFNLSGTSAMQDLGGSGTRSILHNSGSTWNFSSSSANEAEVLTTLSSGSVLNVNANKLTFQSAPVLQGSVNIASGATLAAANNISLNNQGTVSGAGNISTSGSGSFASNGGTISPGGLGTVATLSIAGNVDLTSATLLFDLESAANDQIAVTGNLTSGSASAKLYETGGSPHLDVNEAFSLVTYSGNLTGSPLSLLSQNADIGFTSSSTGSPNGALVATASSVFNRWVDGSGSFNWATGSNWSRAHVPTASEDAIINPSDPARAVTLSSAGQAARSLAITGDDSLRITSGSLSLSTLSTIGSLAALHMVGGTLNGAGDISIGGTFNWSNGTIGGTGDINSAVGSVSTITDTTASLQRDWNNAGFITLASGVSNYLSFANNATLSNSGTMQINSSAGAPLTLIAGTAVTNTGTINWNSGSSNSIGNLGQFINNGQVNVTSGTMRVLNTGIDVGDYDVSTGQQLQFLADRTFGTTTNITGAGTLAFAGGTQTIDSTNAGGLSIAGTGHVRVVASTVNLNTPATTFVNPFTMTGGFLQGSADITIDNTTGALNWSGGVIAGTGNLVTPSGANTSITGAAAIQRDWNNAGNITLDASPAAVLTVQGAKTLANSGTMQVNSTYSTPLNISNGTVNNTGTINWNSATSNAIGGAGAFNNSNLVNIDDGTLSISTSSGTDSGTYDVDAGKRLNFAGNRSLAAGSNVTGAGTLGFTTGTQTVSSTVSGGLGIAGSGHVRVEGAIVNLNTANTTFANALTLTAGNLQGSANYTLTSGMNWSNTTLGGSGVLYTPLGSTSVLSSGLIINRRWENAGAVNMAAGTTNFLYSNNTLVNAAGGVMNIQSTRNSGDVISMNTTNGQFNNAGTLNWNTGTANGGMSGTTGTSFNNTGTVTASGSSTLNLPIPIFTQSGKIDIAAGSTLSRTAGIANAGTLTGGGSINVGTNTLSSSSGTISPGGAGAVAMLSIAGNADFTSATLLFDLQNSSTYDKIAVSGNLNRSASSVQISELAGSPFVSGSDNFSLVSYGGNVSGTSPASTSLVTDVSFGPMVSTAAAAGSLVVAPSSVINRWKDAALDLQWTNAANWSRGHAPTALEDAYISPASNTQAVTLTGAAGSVRSLQLASDDSLQIDATGILTLSTLSTVGGTAALNLAGGTIDGAGELRIAGDLNWSSGLMQGAGILNVQSGADLTITGAVNLSRSLTNTGNVTLSGSSASLTVAGSAIVDNSGSGIFKVLGSAGTPVFLSTSANHFNNAGSLIWDTGAVGGIGGSATFNNTGSVSVASTGTTLNIFTNGGGNDSGSYAIGSGARMNWASGNRSLSSAGSVTGDGSLGITGGSNTISSALGLASTGFLSVSAGDLYLDSASDITFANPLAMSGGGLYGSAHFSLTSGGALNWSGGIMGGTGSLTTDAGAVSQITGSVSQLRRWNNSGFINVSGAAGALSMNHTLNHNTGAVMDITSTSAGIPLQIVGSTALVNNAGTINWNTGVSSSLSGAGTLNNASGGVFNIYDTSTMLADVSNLTQAGTLDIQTGSTLLRATGGLTNAGLIRGGGAINVGTATLTNAASGILKPGDDSAGFGFGTLTVTGNLAMNNTSQAVFDMLASNSDRINVSGNVTFNGASGPLLTVSEMGGATFLGGETHSLFTAGGTFTPTSYTTTGSGDVTFSIASSGSNLLATAIGIDNTWAAATPAGGFWSTGLNWSRGTAPNAYHDVTINQGSTNLVNVSGASDARSLNLSGASNTLQIGLGGSLALHHGNGRTTSSNAGDATLQISGGGTLAIGGSTALGTLDQAANLLFTGNGTISALNSAAFGALINNSGTISILGLSTDTAVIGLEQGANTVSLLNCNCAGTLSAQSGTLSLAAASVTNQGLFEIGSNGAMYLENAFANDGTINLGGGAAKLELNSVALNNNAAGLIKGAGTIAGASGFTNAGTVAPGQGMTGLGTLTISNGGYTQTSGGFLDIRADATGSDVLNDLGGSTLDGTLRMSIRPGSGHAFAGGQIYQPLVSASVGSTFAAVSGISPYLATNSYALGAQVTLANPAGSIVWDGSEGDGQWDNAANWNLNRIPSLGDTVIINPAGVGDTVTLDTGSGFTLFQIPGDDILLINTGGSLGLPGGSTLNGLLHVNGGTLDILGTNTAAQLTMSGGQTNLSGGNLSIGTLALNGGQLFIGTGHTASLTTTGTWGGNSSIVSPVGSPGTFAVGANVPFVVSGAGAPELIATRLNNAGTLWVGLGSGTGGTLGLGDGAVITNSNGASIISMENSGNQILYTALGQNGTVVNAGGHLEARSGSALVIDTSSLSVAGGSYNAPGVGIFFLADNNSYSGALDISAGTLALSTGNHVFASGASQSGAGLLKVDDVAANVELNDFTVNGNVAFETGSLAVNSAQTLTVATGGNLSLSQSVGGSGTIHNFSTIQTFDPGSNQVISPNVINKGIFQVGSNATRSLEFTGGLTLDVFGTVELAAGSTIKRMAGMVNSGTITSAGNATLNVGAGGYSGSGHLSPGGSAAIATLTIAGNADLTSGTADISLQNSINGDRIHVTGNVDLGGSFNLSEFGAAPFVAGGDVFTIVTAGGAITGSATASSANVDLGFTPQISGSNLLLNASSVTNRWNTDVGGLWGAAANWSRGHVPNAQEDVVIDRNTANPTVSVALGITANARSISFGTGANDNLQLSATGGTIDIGSGGMVVPAGSTFGVYGGKVQGSGLIEVNGLVDFSGGEFAGSGNLVVNSSGTFSMSGGVTPMVLSRNLQNSGTVFWDAGEFQVNGQLTNQSGGLFHAGIADAVTDNITGSGIFFNTAGSTFNYGGGGAADLSMQVDFRNLGLVTLSSANASLDLHVGATHSGTFTIPTDTQLRTRGTGSHIFTAGSTIQGAGSHLQSNEAANTSVLGAYTIGLTELGLGSLGFGNGGITVGNLNMSGGTLGASAALALNTATLFGGTLNIASGQTLSLGGNTELAGTVAGTGAGQVRNLAAGKFFGAGSIGVGTGLFSNLGTIAPGIGATDIAIITIAGNANFTSGRVEIGLQNNTTYDKVAVTGNLVGGGTIAVTETAGGFVGIGDAFTAVSFGGNLTGSAPGMVSNIAGVTFNATTASASNNAFTLSPGSVSNYWLMGSGDWETGGNWSRGHAPVSGEYATVSPAGGQFIDISSATSTPFGLDLGVDDTLRITGGSLALPTAANLNILGTLTLDGGNLIGHGTGDTFVAGSRFNFLSGDFTGSGSYFANSLAITGTGMRNLALTGGGLDALGITVAGGQLNIQSGSLNAGSGALVVASGATLSLDGGQVYGTGVTNLGRVDVNAGHQSFNVSGTHTGQFNIFNDANTSLTFNGDSTLASTGSIVGGQWLLAASKSLTSQGTLNRGTGSTTWINGQLNAQAGFETDSLIMLSGGSINASGGLLKVNQSWNDASIGMGQITGFATATLTQAAGSLDFNKGLSVMGAMKLEATGTGATIGSGSNTLAASVINASANSNMALKTSAGELSLNSATGDISVESAIATDLSGLYTTTGKTATIKSSGNVGQSTALNTDGLVVIDIGTNQLTWTDDNNFAEGVHFNSAGVVALASAAANPLTVSGVSSSNMTLTGGAVQLGVSATALQVTGQLTVNASGNITQGGLLNIVGLTDVTSSAGDILLDIDSFYGASGVVFAANAGNAEFNAIDSLALNGSTSGNLTVNAGINITNSGAVGVGGLASLFASGLVTMTHSGNSLPSVSVNAAGLGLRTTGDLEIHGTTTGLSNLIFGGTMVTTAAGQVLNAGSLTLQPTGASAASVDMSVAVSGNTNFSAGTAGYSSIEYTNAQNGGYSNFGASTSVSLTHTNSSPTGILALPQITATAGSVTATSANGSITQTGALLTQRVVANAASDITLMHPSNSFDEVDITSTAGDVALRTVATLDPNITALSGSVSITANGINQSAANAIESGAFSAVVTGGLRLNSSLNSLGSLTATAGADMDVYSNGDLALSAVSASGANGAVIKSTGAITQSSGQISAVKVSLEAESLGTAAAPLQLSSAKADLFATTDAYANNQQASELTSMQAGGTARYTSALNMDIDVTGSVSAQNIAISSGRHLVIGNSLSPVNMTAGNSISLIGNDITVQGGSQTDASTEIFSNGTAVVNANGNFIIQGGSAANTNASFNALGDVTVTALTTRVLGGLGDNAFAKLDPAQGALLTINSTTVEVTGGSGAGAYAAIVSDGDIVINANSLTLQTGSGADSDAVVISMLGNVQAPANCVGCADLGSMPLGDGSSAAGLYRGGLIPTVPEESPLPESALVLSPAGQIEQIEQIIEQLTEDPASEEEEKKSQPEIVIEGQTCS